MNLKHEIDEVYVLCVIVCIRFETMPGDPNKGHCVFVSKPVWVFGMVLLQFINYLILMGFGFRLRNTMAQFNEYRCVFGSPSKLKRSPLFHLALRMKYWGLLKKNSNKYFMSLSKSQAIIVFFLIIRHWGYPLYCLFISFGCM